MKIKLILITVLFVSFTAPITKDYKQEFGSDYVWAVQWLKQHNSNIDRYATQFSVPAKELKAIIFPELIRYNTVYDAIEINSLKYLYVSEGKSYADFSVGYFQMKPSFAEMVEQDATTLLGAPLLHLSGFDKINNKADNEAARKERLTRITSTEQQLVYLCLFYKICEKRFAGHVFSTVNDKLKFFATCYNAGYRRSFEKLQDMEARKFFHTGKVLVSASYNYADISTYYFDKE